MVIWILVRTLAQVSLAIRWWLQTSSNPSHSVTQDRRGAIERDRQTDLTAACQHEMEQKQNILSLSPSFPSSLSSYFSILLSGVWLSRQRSVHVCNIHAVNCCSPHRLWKNSPEEEETSATVWCVPTIIIITLFHVSSFLSKHAEEDFDGEDTWSEPVCKPLSVCMFVEALM